VGLGVALGLVVGKGVGIYAATRLGVRLRIASLPDRVGSRELAGMAAIAGIGFTVSLFVTQLAFDHPVDARRATLAILGASVVAAGLGAALLAAGGRGRRQVTPSP
jgi:NhaA family Na+:H+ antiporter